MSASLRAKWLIVAILVALDAAGLAYLGIDLNLAGLERIACAVLILGATAAFYTYVRPNDRIVDAAQTMGFLLAFFAGTAVFNYILTATALPLRDDAFAAADRALGFDWPAWVSWVHTHPLLWQVLQLAYDSAIPQMLVVTLFLAFTGRPERNSEFLWAMMLSLAVILPVATLWPAAGAWVQYDALEFGNRLQVQDFLAIRDGTLREVDLTKLQGLINFPSFHTTLGVLYAYALRIRGALFGIALALNLVMIASVMSEGGHYLVDMISGAAIPVAALWVTPRLERRLARPSAAKPIPAGLAPASREWLQPADVDFRPRSF